MSNNGFHQHHVITYRALPQTAEDWARLHLFMRDVKGYVPPPQLGVASVAETDTGEIVGGLVLQMAPYLGPFKVAEDWRGRVDYVALKKVIDACYKPAKEGFFGPLIIQGYMALTDDERIARMAETAGMKRLANCIVLVQTVSEQNGVPITQS